MSQTLIGQINTQQIGTTGPDPGDPGESITDSFSGFSLPASDFLTAEPALMPFAAGGSGANGQGGLTNPNPGMGGGAGGAGGMSIVQLSMAAIGALAAPQSHGLSIEAQSYGGYGADGGAGGYGGSLSNAGAGGRGGDGGAASDTFNLLSTYADTTVLVSGQTNLAVFATAGNGGTGGSGGAAGAGSGGGGGGNGGNGAAATATFSNNIAFDNNEMYVNVGAYGGQGGQGGEGGSGNAGTDVPDGKGGNGGNGGNAAAVLTGNTLNAPNITIEMMADLQPGGEGGEGGQAPGESSRGPAGTAGSYGTAQLVVTGNTITVDQPPPGYATYFPETGGLTLDLQVTEGIAALTPIQLDGAAGGNLIFSGNTIAGGGASKLTLNVLGGGVTVDTAAGLLSIDGSPGNTLTGFTSFQLDDNDTFVAGSGTYTVYFNNDPDTVVFTPTSGTVDIQYADPTNLLLDFQGFGPTLNAASLLGDITTNDGNTFINVPDAGQIELGDFEGSIPTGDLAFNAACYLAGTRILTARGEVAVERLRIGDDVLTPEHGWRPIRWIGQRRLDLRRHPAPDDVRPIRFAAGALADGVPKRDLLVSPDHAILVQGMLVPARLLRNDASITRESRLPVVTYFHVELDSHDILLAEGAPAESYLDTGNRDIFDKADATALHPRLTSGCLDRSRGCLPLVTALEQVRPIWRQLAARAGLPADALESPPLEREPHLVLQVGARRLRPVVAIDGRYVFALPPTCAGEARLLSRAGRPHDVWPWADDRRQLGVLVHRLVVDGATLPLDAPALGAGWWPADRGGDAAPRWTDGAAALALPSGAALLSVELIDVGPFVAASAVSIRSPARGARPPGR